MIILYSFNKKGFEADYWQREIAAASTPEYVFVPFNHGVFLDPNKYIRAQLLDNLYYERHGSLMKMYEAFEELIRATRASVVIVDNCFPYHPDYLAKIKIYKVLRITDGPISAYDRDFAYLHAYDQVLYHSPAYSRDMNIEDKLRYCGQTNIDFLPIGFFDAMTDRRKTEETILLKQRRDIDIIFVGALHFTKMPLMAKLKKALGGHLKMHGIASWKRNVYYNIKYGFPGWLTPLKFEDYVPLYQRSKIGVNIHNRGKYTVGNYRLFELPANGVMQISDGGEYLNQFFRVGDEIVGYDSTQELIELIEYYLNHDAERERIALNGFRRVHKDYAIKKILLRAGALIQTRMTSQTEL